MKRIVFLLSLLFIAIVVHAQPGSPVQWSYAAVKKEDKVYTVTITATVLPPWHIYSQNTPKGGPVPTKITFKASPVLTLDGITKEEGNLQVTHDDNFGVDVKFYSNKVVFTQTVKLKYSAKTNITGTVEYMVCDDEKCLPSKKVPIDIMLQ